MAFLHGVEVVEIQDGARPIRTVRTGVIGLVGTAPKGPRNTPTLIAGDRTKAVSVFGQELGTIPDALAAIFEQSGAVVVVVNVLDPATDVVPVAGKAYSQSAGVYRLDDRYVRNVEVKVTNAQGAAQTAGTDYTLDAEAGTITPVAGGGLTAEAAQAWVTYDRLQDEVATIRVPVTDEEVVADDDTAVALAHQDGVEGVVVRSAADAGGTLYETPRDYTVDAAAGTITVVGGGTIGDGTTVYVSYTYQSQRGVADADVIGGAQTDGSLTGIAALRGAESVIGHAPKILIAPGRSDSQSVADALISAADRLRAVAVIEGPSTTDEAAITYRENFGARRAYVVDPGVKVAGADDAIVDRPNSPYVAGVIARSDAERGFWWSPSNRLIRGIVGTAREIDFTLGDANARANLLNEDEIATIIRQKGYRLWGNRTCSADPKWAFLSVVRIADALNDSLLRAHLWAVDRNITRTYLADVADGVNGYIAELVGLGALLGGQCYPTPDLNTAQTYTAGKVYFDFDFNPVGVAERITFRSRLVDDYIEEIFT